MRNMAGLYIYTSQTHKQGKGERESIDSVIHRSRAPRLASRPSACGGGGGGRKEGQRLGAIIFCCVLAYSVYDDEYTTRGAQQPIEGREETKRKEKEKTFLPLGCALGNQAALNFA